MKSKEPLMNIRILPPHFISDSLKNASHRRKPQTQHNWTNCFPMNDDFIN